MVNSRAKGAAGEREAAHAWTRATGLPCARAQQHKGAAGAADLQTGDGSLHIECKFRQRIAALEYLRQAERDCEGKALPLALVRENGDTGWAVLVRLDRLVDLADALVRQRKEPLL